MFKWIIALLSITFVSGAASAELSMECSDKITVKFGGFEKAEDFAGWDFEETVVPKKLRFIKESMLGKTRDLTLKSSQKRSRSRTCVYENKRGGFYLTLKETPKFYTISFEKNYSTETSDSDLLIYYNQLTFKLYAHKSFINQDFEVDEVELMSRFDFYYSCGFIDCTENDDSIMELGRLDQFSLK